MFSYLRLQTNRMQSEGSQNVQRKVLFANSKNPTFVRDPLIQCKEPMVCVGWRQSRKVAAEINLYCLVLECCKIPVHFSSQKEFDFML